MTQANLQVQNGSPGSWNQRAYDFLKQAHGMLPADGNSGPGYMFYATPEQKANVEMYAKYVTNGTEMNVPIDQMIANSVSRDKAHKDLYENLTLGAAPGGIGDCSRRSDSCVAGRANIQYGRGAGIRGTGVAGRDGRD
ncbi:hypothetical protein WT59_15490 [Burkholderia territorii]|nr:hypothetical protein WT59_15490 [Burkholderia territorii]